MLIIQFITLWKEFMSRFWSILKLHMAYQRKLGCGCAAIGLTSSSLRLIYGLSMKGWHYKGFRWEACANPRATRWKMLAMVLTATTYNCNLASTVALPLWPNGSAYPTRTDAISGLVSHVNMPLLVRSKVSKLTWPFSWVSCYSKGWPQPQFTPAPLPYLPSRENKVPKITRFQTSLSTLSDGHRGQIPSFRTNPFTFETWFQSILDYFRTRTIYNSWPP